MGPYRLDDRGALRLGVSPVSGSQGREQTCRFRWRGRGTVDVAIPVGGRDEQRGRLGHDVEDVRIVERTIVRSVGRRDELEIELDLESDAALGMFSDGEAEVRFGEGEISRVLLGVGILGPCRDLAQPL